MTIQDNKSKLLCLINKNNNLDQKTVITLRDSITLANVDVCDNNTNRYKFLL